MLSPFYPHWRSLERTPPCTFERDSVLRKISPCLIISSVNHVYVYAYAVYLHTFIYTDCLFQLRIMNLSNVLICHPISLSNDLISRNLITVYLKIWSAILSVYLIILSVIFYPYTNIICALNAIMHPAHHALPWAQADFRDGNGQQTVFFWAMAKGQCNPACER